MKRKGFQIAKTIVIYIMTLAGIIGCLSILSFRSIGGMVMAFMFLASILLSTKWFIKALKETSQ